MLAKVLSGANVGLDSVPVTIEVDIAAKGLPSFTLVGLGDRAIEESKERVRSALINSEADCPAKRITVNLAPADLPKVGPSFDLPIAVGILVASGQMPAQLSDSLLIGELSLDGSLRSTRGILPLTLLAKKLGLSSIFVPKDNALEAAVVEGITIYPVANLLELFQHFNKAKEIEPQPVTNLDFTEIGGYEYDFKDVKGVLSS